MIELRMRGASPVLFLSALVATAPLVLCWFELEVAHRPIAPVMVSLCVVVALMPWVSRLVAKQSYRAAVDDFALHLGGEALPWSKITRVEEQRSWRRTTLVFHRGETLRLRVVVRDLFDGHMEPMAELTRRLPQGLDP